MVTVTAFRHRLPLIATGLSICLLSCFLTACPSVPITTTLPIILDAATVAFPGVAAAAHLDTVLTNQIEAWLGTLSHNVLPQVQAIEASSDTAAVKDAKIVALFATAAAPNLPAGTPQTVAAVVSAVSVAVAAFLTAYQAPVATAQGARAVPYTAPLLGRSIVFTLPHSTYSHLPPDLQAKFKPKQ